MLEGLESLAPGDLLRLRAAHGWLELGLPQEGLREVESVSEPARLHPATLDVHRAIAASTGDWATAHHVGDLLVQHHPRLDVGWIQRAYAARRMPGGGLALALQQLLPALDRFPACTIIPYNLACYACQLKDLPQARRWYAEAEQREASQPSPSHGSTRKMALEDADLEPLHDWIRALPPARPRA